MSIEQEFIDALRSVDYEPRSYSGRGMFGKACVAIVTDDNPFKVALAVLSVLDDEYDTWKLENVQQDTMGRSTVLYWPSVKWVEE